MNNPQFQNLITEAKAVVKEYPCFNALLEAQLGECWQNLSKQQQEILEKILMPHGAIG